MIKSNGIIKSALTTFKVLDLKYEPNSESSWYLQYNNLKPFWAYEIIYTEAADRNFIGQNIEAQIDLIDARVLPLCIRKKIVENNNGVYLSFTGIYEDDFVYIGQEDKSNIEYIMDSVFKIKISLYEGCMPKKGEWVRIEGEPWIVLPRGNNL